MSNEQKAPTLPAKYAGLPKGRWTTLGEMEAVKLLHADAPASRLRWWSCGKKFNTGPIKWYRSTESATKALRL